MSRFPDTSLDCFGPHRRGPHWAALLAAVCTWPLLLVGGSVTVYRVGMAVPDWPTTFGVNMFLYDFLNSPWGVYLEHTHRLYGSVVGLACIVLAFWATLAEVRPAAGLAILVVTLAAGFLPLAVPAGAMPVGLSVLLVGLGAIGVVSLVLAVWFGLVRGRAVLGLSWFALAAVIGQGVLGGYRVRLNSADLAFVHGCTAQAFFGLLVALCVLAGRAWSRPRQKIADTSNLRLHATVTLGLVLVQIIVGAWLRQHGSPAVLGLHAGLAVAVALYATATAWAALRRRDTVPELAPAAWAMLATVAGQVLLGVLAWWLLRPFDGIARTVWPAQAAVRIAHQGVGALLLASAVVLILRSYRNLGAAPRTDYPVGPSAAQAPRDLEVVS